MNIPGLLNEIAAGGRRMTDDEFRLLYAGADLMDLARAATTVRDRLHPDLITFIIDRNINFTNICTCACKFCAFFRPKGHAEAYLLTNQEFLARVRSAVEQDATQVMLQGGLNPALGIDYFEQLFHLIKTEFPQVTIHSLSPPEIQHIAAVSEITTPEVLARLKQAGLDSLPGGGAEVLDDEVRHAISPSKVKSSTWLRIMEEAHAIGLETTATMMMGSIDRAEHRLAHLRRIRELQDRSGGFRAFIMWSYQPGNNELMGFKVSSMEYLRMLALSRLYLDNISHIQGSWLTQGPDVGQVTLLFGADDLGSIMLEENVVRAAGLHHRMTVEGMVSLIKEAGKRPAQRDTEYRVIRLFD